MTDPLHLDLTDGILTVTLDRPPVNAFNRVDDGCAHRRLRSRRRRRRRPRRHRHRHRRARLLRRRGPVGRRADLRLCARAGLDPPTTPSAPMAASITTIPGVRDGGGLVSLRIFRCRKPVIGAINGAAVGIGATMTLPMDFRLAADTARFGFVFARARHRAGGGVELVLAPPGRHLDRAGLLLFRPSRSRPRSAGRRSRPLGPCARRPARRRPMLSRTS